MSEEHMRNAPHPIGRNISKASAKAKRRWRRKRGCSPEGTPEQTQTPPTRKGGLRIMRKDTLNKRINSLFQQNAWKEARKLLEIEHEKDSEDHWVVTQLGVTFYEEKKYRDALQLFRKSLEIVNDCPLTRWNLAGCARRGGRPVGCQRNLHLALAGQNVTGARPLLGKPGVGRCHKA